MTYPLRPMKLPLWRMIRPQWHGLPFSGEGARLYGGRWNMKGWPALYLAADHVTAVAEYYRGLPRPGTLVPYALDATRIADLTRADDRVSEALACDWKTLALLEGKVPASWSLAQELIAVERGELSEQRLNPRGGQVRRLHRLSSR